MTVQERTISRVECGALRVRLGVYANDYQQTWDSSSEDRRSRYKGCLVKKILVATSGMSHEIKVIYTTDPNVFRANNITDEFTYTGTMLIEYVTGQEAK